MSFLAFIIFGHICIENPGDLDKCWNIYENPRIHYTDARTCMKTVRQYVDGAQLYYRKQDVSITELELYCIGPEPISVVLTHTPNLSYYHL